MNEYSDVQDAVPDGTVGGPAFGRPGAPGRKGQRALWFGVAGFTAIVTVAAAGLPQIGWLAAQTETTTWTSRHPITAVEVDVSGGDLTVRPADRTGPVSLRQTLTWTVNKPQVSEVWHGDTLLITEDCPGPSFTVANPCGATLELAVPAAISMQTTMDSGSLTIRRMTGNLNARAQSGDIELDDDSGTISARAQSGGISSSRLASQRVDAQTLSGDVALDFAVAPTTVTASVESGGVSVTVPRGTTYRVSGQTDSGDRHIAAGVEDDSSPRSIEISSVSGDTSLGYPGDN